jgi:hypothetical protein
MQCDAGRKMVETLIGLGATSQAEELQSHLKDCVDGVATPATQDMHPSAEPPPLIIRGLNFAAAWARSGLGGFKRCTQQEIEARLAICQECPNLKDNHCQLCGCACVADNQLMNKLAMKTASCPMGKWK